MLDEYFKRNDVLDFIKELKSNPKYLKKTVHEETKYGQQMKDELALYLFYDIIFKYKILIDDEYLFLDFLLQVEKLFRKIDNYDDMLLGVYRIFINLVTTLLDVRDNQSEEGRKTIIEYFYQKYVTEGYFVHGYSTTYKEFIKGRNFIPEKYPNHYAKMLRVRQIFAKYKVQIMDKDFQKCDVSFTDDIVMGCHYSITSPGYFYQMITTCCKDNTYYLKQNYHALSSSLKRFMTNYSFRYSDQKVVLKIVEEEWNFIHRVPRKISLMFVKKQKFVSSNDDKLKLYLESDKSLLEIVERILTPKYHNLCVNQVLRYGEYQLIDLEDYYQAEEVKNTLKVKEEHSLVPMQFANSYGVASILLIVGSLFITLGVLISIIMILRGM